MIYGVTVQLVGMLIEWLMIRRRSDAAKDLEILVLRHQLRVLQRTARPVRFSRWDKLLFAALTIKLKASTANAHRRWRNAVILVSPDTILRWHRDLVRRKWTFARRHNTGGRPRIDADLENLILQLAQENPRWGYARIHGELCKLTYTVGRSTVRDVLKRHRIPPTPKRTRPTTWRAFLSHHRQHLLACDFFVVETAFLRTIYVLFFIELGSRRVHFAGCTQHPTAAWVTQQARHLSWQIQDGTLPVRFLIHDRDATFPASFDTVFATEDIEIVLTPYRAPNANAVAERWVRSAREECLDHLLILNQRYLARVLTDYVAFFNQRRPHQGLDQRCPVPLTHDPRSGPVQRHDILGGLIHDYDRQAA